MKILLFDFDGVITDTFEFCHGIENMRHPLTQEEYRAMFEGNINEAIRQTHASAPERMQFDYFAFYTPELLKRQPYEGMREIIQTLAKTHELVIISSAISSSIDAFWTMGGLRQEFKEILGKDVEESKIKKIQDVLLRYHASPEEAVLVTDTLGDIREANKCAVRSIAVTWGFHPFETLQKGNPYQIIDRPDQIIQTIQSMDRGASRS